MNFVICTYDFPPENGAEAFCSARFASALARAGHHIHVVTVDHSVAISDISYQELVDPRIIITRVSKVIKSRTLSIFYRIRYLTVDYNARYIPKLIKATKEVLSQYEDPILISRYSPECSHIAAYYCKNLAFKWIAHFSDPFPNIAIENTIRERVRYLVQKRWGKKFIFHADKISITCNNVRRFFETTYGKRYNMKVVLATHIGYPMLSSMGFQIQKKENQFVVSHTGTFFYERYAKYIIEELKLFSVIHKGILFIQYGPICPRVKSLFNASLPFEWQIREINDPRCCSDIFEQSDVNLVADLRAPLEYSPFLPSKFVYAVFSNRPVVCVSCGDSEMAKFANQYGEGVFFADGSVVGDLNDKLESIYNNPKQSASQLLRSNFVGEKVAADFVSCVVSRE